VTREVTCYTTEFAYRELPTLVENTGFKMIGDSGCAAGTSAADS